MARRLNDPESGVSVLSKLEGSVALLGEPRKLRGRVYAYCESHVVTSAESNGDIVALFRVRANDTVRWLVTEYETIGSTTACSIGFYEAGTTTVVDSDALRPAFSLAAGAQDVALSGFYHRRIWEALGLSADPEVLYDVCMTYTGEPDASGNIGITMFVTPEVA